MCPTVLKLELNSTTLRQHDRVQFPNYIDNVGKLHYTHLQRCYFTYFYATNVF